MTEEKDNYPTYALAAGPITGRNAALAHLPGIITLASLVLLAFASFVIAGLISSWLIPTIYGAILLIGQAVIGAFHRYPGNVKPLGEDMAAAFGLAGSLAALVGIIGQLLQVSS